MEKPRITDYGDIAIDEYGNTCARTNTARRGITPDCGHCNQTVRGSAWGIEGLYYHPSCVRVQSSLY